MPINLERAQTIMTELGLDAILASSPENFFYASDLYIPFIDRFRGFLSGLGAFALIPREGDVIVSTTALDAELAKLTSPIKDIRFTRTWAYFQRDGAHEIEVYENPVESLTEIVKELGLTKGKIGIEEKTLPIVDYRNITKSLPDTKFIDASKTFLNIRSVKLPEEIARIRKVCEVSEKAFDAAFSICKVGTTEAQILGAFQQSVLDSLGYIPKGIHHQNFTIGVHSATVRRGEPLDLAVQEGDIMRFDGGAIYKGYRCDFARTHVLGKAEDKVKKIYSALVKAEENIISMIKPGVKFSDLFKMGLKTVQESGYPEFMRKHFGHGLGLITEEEPLIAPNNDVLVQEDMVLCVEVPYYWTGVGGFNAEDVVHVQSDGVEVFTPNLSKELEI
ncbi:MAG: Xaa-Pro peptidase family protein [Candidatus Thorarchaeota archaeon]